MARGTGSGVPIEVVWRFCHLPLDHRWCRVLRGAAEGQSPADLAGKMVVSGRAVLGTGWLDVHLRGPRFGERVENRDDAEREPVDQQRQRRDTAHHPAGH